MIKKCVECNQNKPHHAKGLCYSCYKKVRWVPKIAIKKECERCKNKRIIHSKGLCASCYNFIFHLDKVKELNYKKSFNLTLKQYKKLTKSCFICGFNKLVELHHLDENKSNNSRENLIALCPNHHKMIHNFKFRQEIREILQEKGLKLPFDPKLDYFLPKIKIKSES